MFALETIPQTCLFQIILQGAKNDGKFDRTKKQNIREVKIRGLRFKPGSDLVVVIN
jgi:hypothetical protein